MKLHFYNCTEREREAEEIFQEVASWRIDVLSSTVRREGYFFCHHLLNKNFASFCWFYFLFFIFLRNRLRHTISFHPTREKKLQCAENGWISWPLLDSIHTRSSTYGNIVIILSLNFGPLPCSACIIFVILLFFIIT